MNEIHKSDLYIDDYLDKIFLLEKSIGAKTTYKILEPFPVDTEDSLSIQKAAKTIADFVGLNNLVFIVAKTKQKSNVGGYIELNNNENEVFIEISDNISKSQNAVLAVLAHEITHKYMQINAISCGTGPLLEYENEILTDITSIFLGFGKLMLNGYEIVKESVNIVNYTRETIKIGYLNKKQIAFVYRLICAMRKIPKNDMLSGLSSEAISEISDCYCYEEDYFNQEFHNNKFQNELVESLINYIQTLQDELNQINRHLELIKTEYINKTETFLDIKQQNLKNFYNDLRTLNQYDTYDPCLIYLITIKNRRKIEQMKIKLSQEISDAKEVKQNLNTITKLDEKKRTKKSFLKKIFNKVLRN
ncbi:hypothetical protein [Candidatus Syntrophosphaera thermopropionivorans]|jgi:hypothetical protein|uniref:Uncharacterized protein n=1 Tax=Candidatus Syntrophosphaera thermopropionivorans TaxID=2593015 RepID=A0AC61QK94_9BACT|nr:hypothetical protein [Candidatus Syntrophosphaera thermopropionivorans]TDF73827.1 hypothetical protein E0946_02085 [Candidatus Syntrophosphaera thermopropionivorans]HPQ30590.1 hypothetical protein [Candidatus Syntrophosphaera thermopropionivorans]